MTLLDISDFTLDLPDGTRLLDGVSLSVAEGETVGLVGESGSGKSLTARSVIGLQPRSASTTGTVRLDGHDVLGASVGELLALRRTSAGGNYTPCRTPSDWLLFAALASYAAWPPRARA